MQRITAIIPAAGIGKRFGKNLNKVFYSLLNKPVLLWTLEIFQSLKEVTEIVPVLKEEDMSFCNEIVERHNISKVRFIVPGGKERQDSVYNALCCLKEDVTVVITHDGVRPVISRDLVEIAIKDFLANMRKGIDGVVVGVPVKDTLKEVTVGDKRAISENALFVKKTLDRDTVWAIQTPQVFSFKKLKEAYDKALSEGFYSTDDSALLERYGGNIKIILGSYKNIKITTPEDISIAEVFLRS
jgi:2-C-methyl-D-erythritol 4-phosphate cytidylyltransferase